MRRLRDEAGDDPVAVRGIELLRRTPPAVHSPESKRRVWKSIQRAHATRVQGFRLPKLRMAVVVIGVLCLAGSAGAVIAARRWIAPALRETFSRAAPAPTEGARTPAARPLALRRTPTAPSLPRASISEHEPQVATISAVPAGAPSAVTPAPLRRVASRRRLSTTADFGAGVTNGASEPFGGSLAATSAAARERTEVLDAMVALRRDRDPVTAGRMLDSYLTAHPTGALREEALVLAIEAAAARGDLAMARSLARHYQAAYPTGRFRPFAQATASP